MGNDVLQKAKRRAEGSVFARGDKWVGLIDLGDRPAQRCDMCRRNHWLVGGRKFVVCPRCGGSLRDVKARRRRWLSGFGSEKAASRAVRKELDRVDQGLSVAPEKTTVGEYLVQWLAGRPHLRESTLSSYKGMVKLHIVPAIGSVRLQKLAPDDVRALHQAVRAKGRSARTVELCHVILRAALATAVKDGTLARNVADVVERPKPQRREMRTWTPEQFLAFLDHARDDRFRAAYALAGRAGLRRGELLGVQWSDLDLDGTPPRVTIRRTVVSVEYRVIVSKPKTDAGRRSVSLGSETVAALKEHRKAQLKERIGLGLGRPSDEDFVFANVDGSVVHPDQFAGMFERLVRSSRLPRIRFHDLRHTHAAFLAKARVHPKVMQARLGHASITTTLNTYGHLMEGMDAEAADAVEALIEGGRQ